ncbi:MAG: mechanosensitive ion channel family protein [Chloroflexi bacterium]|nr:mechanosensitive ion channel family protein [Chloroflexota bacterium]
MLTLDNEYIIAILIAAVTAAVAAILEVALKIVKSRMRAGRDDYVPTPRYIVLEAIDGPAILIILLAGGTFAGGFALDHWHSGRDLDTDLAALLRRVGTVGVVAVSAFLATRIGSLLLDWYAENVAPKTSTQLDDQLMPSFKRMLPILVYALAILWGLAIFEIEISPLLATLGIGGIAIALAAQPTLSNYFAGTYVISEGEIEPGDFIEIEGGPSGFVEDISWRSTKLRSRFNNLIIIPNSMMSENMITNYSRPALAMNVIVTGGVSYSSDLQQVEDILMEVANKIVVESEHAVTETEPRAGFSVFGDSNIDFWVFLQATDRAGSFQLKSQLIKQILLRFNEAGIVINYPIRHLVVDDVPEEEEGAEREPTPPEQIVEFVRKG